MCFEYLALDDITNIVTIFGVLYAAYAYWRWKIDHKEKERHEFSVNLYKKIMALEFRIEEMRRAKLYYPDNIWDTLDKFWLNEIKNSIWALTVQIDEELCYSDLILCCHEEIKEKYDSEMRKKILYKINSAIIEFNLYKDSRDEKNYKELKLFKLLYPYEDFHNDFEISARRSGGKCERIKDEFSKEIDDSFEVIYKLLKKEMLT